MKEVKLIKDLAYDYKYYANNNYSHSNLNLVKKTYEASELVTLTLEEKDIARRIARKYKTTFDTRGGATKEQLYFAKETARLIAGTLKENIVTVVPAPCGFGKSSITEEILKTKIEDIKNKKTTDGIIIVTNKLDALREAKSRLEDGYSYILEGWNEEICNNKEMKKNSNKICPSDCPYFSKCKMIKQQQEQKDFPILFLTNARLKDSKENINIYANWNKGKRTILLIDEKPVIEDTLKINTKLLNDIDTALSQLNYKLIEDKELLKKKWNNIRNKFEEDIFANYRSKYTRFIVSRKSNEIICKNDKEFMELWNKYMKDDFRLELTHINRALSEGGLYVSCLNDNYYSKKKKDNEFIATIGYRNLREMYSNNFKTIIFDGTGLYDKSYENLEEDGDLKFLYIDNPRNYDNVKIKVFEEHRLSKFNFNEKKYLINGLADFINFSLKTSFGNVFVVTYKEKAQILGEKIKTKKVIRFDDETNSLYYFGNTKGSNDMSECTKMYQLGWETMPDYEYLISFLCTCVDWDKTLDSCLVLKKAEELSEKFIYKEREEEGCCTRFKSKRFGFSNIDNFKRFDTVVKFYQEVHRTKLRDYNYKEEIEVNLFKNEKMIFNMIQFMLPNCKINYKKEEISFIKKAKTQGRKAKEGKEKTNPQILLNYIENLEKGTIVKMKDLIDGSGLSRDQIKRAKDNHICKEWFNMHSLKSKNGKSNGSYIA